MTYLKAGSRVMVALPEHEYALTKGSPLWRFNGQIAKIKKIKTVQSYVYYELDGMVSDKGIPYSFVPDWIIRMED